MKIKLLAFIAFICFLSTPAIANENLVRACSDPWPPLIIGDEEKQASGGLFVNVLQEVLTRMGLKSELHLMPWKRCLKMIEEGEMDVTISCVYSKDRTAYLTPSDPFFMDTGVWYYNRAKFPKGFEWRSYEDFKGYSIGGTLGSDYSSFSPGFAEAEKKGWLKLDRAKTTELAFKQLVAGNIDFHLDMKTAGDGVLKTLGGEKKVGSPKKPLYVNLQRFCVSKKSFLHKSLPDMNQKIGELRSEGLVKKKAKDTGIGYEYY